MSLKYPESSCVHAIIALLMKGQEVFCVIPFNAISDYTAWSDEFTNVGKCILLFGLLLPQNRSTITLYSLLILFDQFLHSGLLTPVETCSQDCF